MRRCYRGIALALGTVLMLSPVSEGSCSMVSMTVYAAEDTLTEEMQNAFQEEVRTGEENVETEAQTEEENFETEAQAEEAAQPEPEPTPAVSGGFQLEEQEYQILLKIVEAEAGGEDTIGKLLVANVVLNRVRSGHFPNTVSSVVYQTHNGKPQFSPAGNGQLDSVNVSGDTVEAVARAMNGEDVSQGALYFRSVRSTCGWFDRALSRVVEHGNHIFYR